jgi:NTE family protein
MRLVIGGGGSKGIVFVGAYDEYLKRGALEGLTEIYGVSIGSVLGMGVVLGLSPDDILSCYNENFPCVSCHLSVKNFINKLGFDAGEDLKKMIISMMRKGGCDENTLMTDLRSRDVQLRVCVTNLNTYTADIIDTDSKDVKVIDALMASCAIPIFYAPVFIGGQCYVDGGALWNSFPYSLVRDDHDDIGWGLINTTKDREINNVKTYLSNLVTLFTTYFARYSSNSPHKKNVVMFKDVDIPLIVFNECSDEKVQMMLNTGRRAAEDHLDNTTNTSST